MKRKRFIKLLMSHGYSRNKAVKIANYYNRRNIPYEKAYTKSLLAVSIKLRCISIPFIIACRALSEEFENLASAFKRAIKNTIRTAGDDNA